MAVLSPSPSHAALAQLVARSEMGQLVSSVAMPGGASTRSYFRVTLGQGRTVVAMFAPEGGRSAEIHRHHVDGRWPFLEVRDLLAARGIDVPKILAEDTENGWVLVEDLGDETLANWLLKHPHDREALYTKAVTDLARAQRELVSLPEDHVVASRTFDADLLRWELEHFREWALDARDKSLSASDLEAWNGIADRLSKRIAALPSGFVHRDYQSRNLMVVPGEDLRLVWIDFQDAVLGPRVYDLVALFTDSVQEFDRAFVEARLRDYALAAGCTDDLAAEFDLVTVLRKFKDAGRFVFVDRQKGNARFLEFVTPTIKKAVAAMTRLASSDPDMAQLRDILVRTLGSEIE